MNWNSKMVELLESAGYHVRSYSGRGMFGEKCIAVECSRGVSSFKVCADLCHEACSSESEAVYLHGDGSAKDFVEWLSSSVNVAEDSMGYDRVIYFPNVPLPEGFEEKSED